MYLRPDTDKIIVLLKGNEEDTTHKARAVDSHHRCEPMFNGFLVHLRVVVHHNLDEFFEANFIITECNE